jgi:hypothetical protein
MGIATCVFASFDHPSDKWQLSLGQPPRDQPLAQFVPRPCADKRTAVRAPPARGRCPISHTVFHFHACARIGTHRSTLKHCSLAPDLSRLLDLVYFLSLFTLPALALFRRQGVPDNWKPAEHIVFCDWAHRRRISRHVCGLLYQLCNSSSPVVHRRRRRCRTRMDASLSLSTTGPSRNGRGGKRSMRLERLRAKEATVELARPLLQSEGWVVVSFLRYVTGSVQTISRHRPSHLGDDFTPGEFK